MDLVPPSVALVQERQLEQSPNVGAVAGERDEERDVGGVVLRALTVGIEVNRPLVAADHERIGSYVFSDPHALGEREPADPKLVGPIHRLGARRRCRRHRRGTGGGMEEGDGFRGFSPPLDCAHPRPGIRTRILLGFDKYLGGILGAKLNGGTIGEKGFGNWGC